MYTLKFTSPGTFYNFGSITIGDDCVLSLVDENNKIQNLAACNYIGNTSHNSALNGKVGENYKQKPDYALNAAYYDLINDNGKAEDFFVINSIAGLVDQDGEKITPTSARNKNIKLLVSNSDNTLQWDTYIISSSSNTMDLNIGGGTFINDIASNIESIKNEIQIIGKSPKSNWHHTALKTLSGTIINISGSTNTYDGHSNFDNLPSDAKFGGSIFSIDGYIDEISPSTGLGEVEPVDKATTVNQKSGYVRYYGDNSWYNGVFTVASGATADIDTTGSIFGGDINLETGAKLIWRGGAKDPNNKPTITMLEGSQLDFVLPQTGADNIFSVYGIIKTEETVSDAQINIESGTIFIKNDCSGFKGHLDVQDGARVIVRRDVGSSGQHHGKMFGGTVATAGSFFLDTDNGLESLYLTKGQVHLTGTEDSAENCLQKNVHNGPDTEVINELENAVFYKFVIDGVKFTLGKNLHYARFLGTSYVASSIDTMDGVI
ncbi:MAG: hypothetical protein LBB29_01675 [Holosporaceae bacterium]|jgi:hypothetical protein|nr:hypothetical protein [Holosporaceae bacterium]